MPKTPKLSRVARLCHRAAGYIEERGHCRMTVRGRNGEVCMGQALTMAMKGENALFDGDVVTLLAPALGFRNPLEFLRWNAAKSRRKSQVLARLRSVS